MSRTIRLHARPRLPLDRQSDTTGPACPSRQVSRYGADVKTFLTLCVLSMAIPTACRHPEPPVHSRRLAVPERRSTEAEIRLHIVGEWTVADNSDDCWYPTLVIAGDGSLTGVLTNGTRVLIGTWEMSNTLLRVTPTKAARASGFFMNDWDYLPVLYADDHELVMTPGISVAGRWRYKR